MPDGDNIWQQRVNSAAVADAQSTNAGLEGDRHDVFTFGISEPDPRATMSAQAPTQIDLQRSASCTNSTHYQPNGLLAGAARSGQSRTGSQSHAKDAPLQIQDAGASRGPVESSVWNWDTPLDTIGESASYYYEPQGELLQEHRELGPSSTDFSIPHAIGSVDGTWKLANCETACDSTQAHTVPTRPSSVLPPTAGVKRKLAVEQELSEGNSDPKRPSCVMSDAVRKIHSGEVQRTQRKTDRGLAWSRKERVQGRAPPRVHDGPQPNHQRLRFYQHAKSSRSKLATSSFDYPVLRYLQMV
ncbi:hypothetical protein LTR33_013994, partial [Friedmanniomyces endolithicus]